MAATDHLTEPTEERDALIGAIAVFLADDPARRLPALPTKRVRIGRPEPVEKHSWLRGARREGVEMAGVKSLPVYRAFP